LRRPAEAHRGPRVRSHEPNADSQRLDNPTELAGDPVLSGFALDVSRLFAPGF
jgi:hypothetical protein